MLDLLFILLTAVAFQSLGKWPSVRGPLTVVTVLFWVGYIIVRAWREPGLLRAWGFTTERLRPAATAGLIALIAGVLGIILYAAIRGNLWVPMHFWLLLA